jgi:hypothetical protein
VGLTGRNDFEVGRRSGNVLTDDDESTADVLEVTEPLEAVLALELANLDNFDCFTGLTEDIGCLLDFEVRSGISGMDSMGGNGALGGRGGSGAELRDSDVVADGAGS